MVQAHDDQMVQITGSDDFGWSWKRVDKNGNIVSEGKTTLAKEALSAATEMAKRPRLRSLDRKLRR